MTEHLLLIALGPVQEFIAQARRTRDLWYGSHVLSELARTAARSLVEQGASLVFPPLGPDDPELKPCMKPLRPETNDPPLNVANKVLAVVPSGHDPRAVARTTRKTVKGFWRDEIAARVAHKCAGLIADGIDATWREQVDTLLEFVAAWAPLGDYAVARRNVERAVAARKNLRDFRPWMHQRGNVPKSSLDGARETVLRRPRLRDAKLARRYRIAEGEQLDAVGLIKRAGGEPEQFVPIVNVALAGWLALANREALAELEHVRQACKELGVGRVVRRDLRCGHVFGFDASVFLPSRWKALFDELGLPGDADQWGNRHVRPVLDRLVEPYPYVACLVADGDRMGHAIDRLTTAREHREFSRALAKFASRARNVVEQKHLGSLVYAGGDDVLAFLPLPEALECADALRHEFAAIMEQACASLSHAARPTLSVGLGIGHIMDGMGELLELGREAERLAKGGALAQPGRDRNALAVLVDKRSGGRRAWRARWDDWGGNPIGRIRQDIALLEGPLSSRKVYEVASLLRRLPSREQATGRRWARVLAQEVHRSLSRVQAGDEEPLDPAAVGLHLDEADYPMLYERVSTWVDRMLVARTLAFAVPRLRLQPEEGAS